jgi:TRAP-type C4-dicarboxylate transport system substrate-binding protein
MQKRFPWATALGAATIAAAFVTVSAQAQTIELRFHTLIPPVANPIKTMWQPWTDTVNAAAKGKMKVTIYPAMQLGGTPPQLVDQVKDGVVDITWTLPGYTPGRFPVSEVFELPFVHTNPVATTLALQDFQSKYLKDEFKGYHVLLLHVHAGSLIMSKRPILKFEDMKGLSIRTATRTMSWYLDSIGAQPIDAPVPEVVQMISRGVVHALALPYEIAPAFKVQDLVDNYSELAGKQARLNTSVFSFLMNPNSYAKLPADMKAIIDQNSGYSIARKAGENWAAIEEPAKKVMASVSRNKFHTIPAAEAAKFAAAGKAAKDRWIAEMGRKGLNGAAMLKEAEDLVRKYTY